MRPSPSIVEDVATISRVREGGGQAHGVAYRLLILRLLGQAVRAGSSGWVTSSVFFGSLTRRAAARARPGWNLHPRDDPCFYQQGI